MSAAARISVDASPTSAVPSSAIVCGRTDRGYAGWTRIRPAAVEIIRRGRSRQRCRAPSPRATVARTQPGATPQEKANDSATDLASGGRRGRDSGRGRTSR
jgi:hypothetical protein